MADSFTSFHYLASTVPADFDLAKEDFDVKEIYQFYSLKVNKLDPLSPASLNLCVYYSMKEPQYRCSWTKCSVRSLEN